MAGWFGLEEILAMDNMIYCMFKNFKCPGHRNEQSLICLSYDKHSLELKCKNLNEDIDRYTYHHYTVETFVVE